MEEHVLLILTGGFKYLLFSSLPGEDSHFELKPPTSDCFSHPLQFESFPNTLGEENGR